ncbi:MAG: RNA polymerase sigma factor RpoD/SigA [Termitinemataceae bacterium]|nr:MAG: RNA polymerase sigma factor RpoD/SigA [Termitinemataceae bacterium]
MIRDKKVVEEESTENVVAIYLKEIRKIPLLTREEEDEFAARAAKGDKAALNKLVQCNLRFVVNVAKRYQGHGLPISDLISEGNIGLINAVEHFDLEKGCHFITYAVWWVKQAIMRAICEKSRIIRLPNNRSDDLLRIIHTQNAMTSQRGQEVEIAEIAEKLNMDKDRVRTLLNVGREMISLDLPLYQGYSDRDEVLCDHIADVSYRAPDEEAEKNIMHSDIEDMLGTLPKKEAEIVRCRYGIGTNSPMSLSEIGNHFHLTKERIRQIEIRAIKHLLRRSNKELLLGYVA